MSTIGNISTWDKLMGSAYQTASQETRYTPDSFCGDHNKPIWGVLKKDNENELYPQFEAKYTQENSGNCWWIGRKVIALPAAVIHLTFKPLFHLLLTAFSLLKACFCLASSLEAKMYVGYILRDLEGALGYFALLFSDQEGSYLIGRANWHKEYYDEVLRKEREPALKQNDTSYLSERHPANPRPATDDSSALDPATSSSSSAGTGAPRTRPTTSPASGTARSASGGSRDRSHLKDASMAAVQRARKERPDGKTAGPRRADDPSNDRRG